MTFGLSLSALDLKKVEISLWKSLRPFSNVRVFKKDLDLLVKNKLIVDL